MISPESLLSKRESLKETTFRGQREGRGPTAFRGEVVWELARDLKGIHASPQWKHPWSAILTLLLVRNPTIANNSGALGALH